MSVNDFKLEYEKIKSHYYNDNPFKEMINRKEFYAKKPLILYGFGVLCRAVIRVCRDFDIKIAAICDTNKTGMDQETGLEILSPEQLKLKYPDANVVICSNRYAEDIKQKLISLGFEESTIFQSTFSMNSFIHPLDFEQNHLEGYEWAYNFFTDDISKQLVIDRIKMYITGAQLTKTSDVPIYFEPGVISLGKDEVFVDGGAFIGDTVEEFIAQTKIGNTGEYRHIYSFEPDDAAYKTAVHNMKEHKNVDVIPKGLWSCDTELKFFSDGGNASSSFVIGTCRITVPVTSIDSFFSDKSFEDLPTYIKMDIEGAEKEALIGAKGVIARKHPKLAVCIYHKPEDIYELTKLIYQIDPSYKFTLRQCAEGLYDTVMYAV